MTYLSRLIYAIIGQEERKTYKINIAFKLPVYEICFFLSKCALLKYNGYKKKRRCFKRVVLYVMFHGRTAGRRSKSGHQHSIQRNCRENKQPL